MPQPLRYYGDLAGTDLGLGGRVAIEDPQVESAIDDVEKLITGWMALPLRMRRHS